MIPSDCHHNKCSKIDCEPLRIALGSTIGLTNSSGSIATSYTYDPFGYVTAGRSASANPYHFTGRENDGTGLYFNRARYYSPSFQRFISQDPIGFRGVDTNLYGYAYDNPVGIIDSFGFAGGAGQCSRVNRA